MHLESSGPATFRLSPDVVHIWVVPLVAPSFQLQAFERLLAADEIERASRFRFSHLREAFILARGALRYLLGRYLHCDPASICIRYSGNGKPELCPPAPLHFNLSHSHGLAALAVANGCPIGIDLEQLRPVRDMEEIADRYFCLEEAAELLPLPPPERDRAFFACWTRKEAFLKATGDGFQCPLNSFRVTVLPNVDARLMHISGDPSAAEKWTLHDLQLAPGYAAALAYQSPPRSLSLFRLSDLNELPSV